MCFSDFRALNRDLSAFRAIRVNAKKKFSVFVTRRMEEYAKVKQCNIIYLRFKLYRQVILRAFVAAILLYV